MGKIVLDEATAKALREAEPGVEMVGPSGETIGGFVPPKILYDLHWMLEDRQRKYEEELDAIDIEELQAAEAEGGEIPHEEVMKRLGLE